ncbi:MAG: 3'-5' exonuclease [Candidatus Kapaibacterium sp.]|nr:3'-5' exonuclease [Candidatus Kapabacteria bacterium]
MKKQQYLIFDIETAPLDFEKLSESQQEYILRHTSNEEEVQAKKFEMALSPITAQVVCIGTQLMQSGEQDAWEQVGRAALSLNNDLQYGEKEHVKLSTGDDCYITNEAKLLEDFWAILRKYENAVLISFNGRNFDAPFLMLRSAIQRIKPSRNLMSGTKFNYPMHIDLIDELTFYNPSPYSASKRFNFDFYTRTFGIKSPKSEGVDGSMVGELFRQGKHVEIAEYCMRDINATWELFLIWNQYLRF